MLWQSFLVQVASLECFVVQDAFIPVAIKCPLVAFEKQYNYANT